MTDNKQKRALLLYQAGQATQDIFYTLAETDDDDDHDSAVSSLDTYFSPKKTRGLRNFQVSCGKAARKRDNGSIRSSSES